jgi:PEP-CTERM motif
MKNLRLITPFGLALAGFVAAFGGAHAQVTEADVGLNATNEQTGPTTVTTTGGFFSARAFVNSSTDFTGGMLNYGGSGSPQTLGFVPADTAWEYGSPQDPSFSDLQTQFPTGGYTFSLTGGAFGPTTVNIDYAGNAYSNTPELTAGSFTGLQGLDSADPFTVNFNEMVANPSANASFVFFTVFNSSNATVFSQSFLPSDTPSVTIPGGVLLPGQTYTFDLIFSDRITGFDDNAGVPTTQFYDTRTDGSFFTAAGAVPEPSTWAMLLVGFVGLGFAASLRGRKQGATAIGG